MNWWGFENENTTSETKSPSDRFELKFPDLSWQYLHLYVNKQQIYGFFKNYNQIGT